jgi:uncharacterized membrane protein YhaH (DUF805 family)
MEGIMIDWVLEVFSKYAVFSGRARRKEYWYWYFFNFIISIFIAVVSVVINLPFGTETDNGIGWFGLFINLVAIVYSLGIFIPNLAVTIRRLHDTNRSGWSYFISLIPFIGGLILLIYLVEDSTPGDNQYGPNPKNELETTA